MNKSKQERLPTRDLKPPTRNGSQSRTKRRIEIDVSQVKLDDSKVKEITASTKTDTKYGRAVLAEKKILSRNNSEPEVIISDLLSPTLPTQASQLSSQAHSQKSFQPILSKTDPNKENTRTFLNHSNHDILSTFYAPSKPPTPCPPSTHHLVSFLTTPTPPLLPSIPYFQPESTPNPQSVYTKAMAGLQKTISEKERENIRLKGEYERLREEFADPVQCDRMIEGLMAELKARSREAEEIVSHKNMLINQRSAIEQEIHGLRDKVAEQESSLVSYQDIIRKSKRLILKKDEEIREISNLISNKDSSNHTFRESGLNRSENSKNDQIEFVEQVKQQEVYQRNWQIPQYYQEEIGPSQKMRNISESNNDQTAEPRNGIPSLKGETKQADHRRSRSLSPISQSHTAPNPAVVMDMEELYQLKMKKQALREQMRTLAQSQQHNHPDYKGLQEDLIDLDELISIKQRIIDARNEEVN